MWRCVSTALRGVYQKSRHDETVFFSLRLGLTRGDVRIVVTGLGEEEKEMANRLILDDRSPAFQLLLPRAGAQGGYAEL